jgi:hypothetical protein
MVRTASRRPRPSAAPRIGGLWARRLVVLAAAAAVAGAVAAWPSPAAAGGCSLVAPSTVEHALSMHHGQATSALSTPPALGGTRATCLVSVWRGPAPTSAARARRKLQAGTLAELDVTTWAPEAGPLSASWLSHGFTATLDELVLEDGMRIVTDLHGMGFHPPPLGAEAAGYEGTGGRVRTAAGLWWSSAEGKLMQLTLRSAVNVHTVSALRSIAVAAVPAFGL